MPWNVIYVLSLCSVMDCFIGRTGFYLIRPITYSLKFHQNLLCVREIKYTDRHILCILFCVGSAHKYKVLFLRNSPGRCSVGFSGLHTDRQTDDRQTHTHGRTPSTSDQPVAESATYTTRNKHKRLTPVP